MMIKVFVDGEKLAVGPTMISEVHVQGILGQKADESTIFATLFR